MILVTINELGQTSIFHTIVKKVHFFYSARRGETLSEFQPAINVGFVIIITRYEQAGNVKKVVAAKKFHKKN